MTADWGTTAPNTPNRFDTVVIGGSQAGLSVGFHLKRHDIPFVILDAGQRVGDSWRHRWDSLRLFTPARYDGLVGMPFPTAATHYPTKDEMADYLESYATSFELPVLPGVRVDRLSRNGTRFVVTAGERKFEAENVVVAMWNQRPNLPSFARDLDPGIVQMHSVDYRNPSQLQQGGVLVVGAGNSGAEIALEAGTGHETMLSGQHPGHVPFPPNRFTARFLAPVMRTIFHRVLSEATPIGRKVRPKMITHAPPLVRAKPKHLKAAGVKRVSRTVGVVNGRPLLEDQSVVDVANVVWCTGFRPDFSWIELPVFGEKEPRHDRGVVTEQPGLYFVGLQYLYSVSSAQINGVGRDAGHVADAIASRAG